MPRTAARVSPEEKMLFELQDRFAELAGLETLTLAVDVEPNNNTEDEIL